MKKLVFLLVAFSFIVGNCWAEGFNYGVLDLDELNKNYTKMTSTMEHIQDLYDQEMETLREMTMEIGKLEEDLKERADLMPDDMRKEKQVELREKKSRFLEYQRLKEYDLNEEKNKQLDFRREEILKAVREVALEDKLNFVIEKGALIFDDGKHDITAKVVAKLNSDNVFPIEGPEKVKIEEIKID